MSGRITDASRRRMAQRDLFVSLDKGDYITIEERATGLPVVSIDVKGLPVQEGLATELLAVVKTWLDTVHPDLKYVKRRTA